MAIQLPNPGLGDGQTGDNEYVMWTKVKDNFSDQTNAASRLVGANKGQVPLAEDVLKAMPHTFGSTTATNLNDVEVPSRHGFVFTPSVGNTPPGLSGGSHRLFVETHGVHSKGSEYTTLQKAVQTTGGRSTGLAMRTRLNGVWSEWTDFWHDKNTLKEERTGHLYTSSPVILLRDGTMDKLHEAEDMDCELVKNGVGDYTLKNTTGLRDNDWHAVPPKDIHGNPLCMIVVTEPSEGEVNVKTYKRKFDLEKAAVVADLEQPFDIPEGASVRLHFNDIPQEQLDEPIE